MKRATLCALLFTLRLAQCLVWVASPSWVRRPAQSSTCHAFARRWQREGFSQPVKAASFLQETGAGTGDCSIHDDAADVFEPKHRGSPQSPAPDWDWPRRLTVVFLPDGGGAECGYR